MIDYTVDSDGNGNPIAAPIETPYDSKRQMEYPRIGEQLDMLWHELHVNGTLTNSGDWYKSIQAIKNKYPKE